MAEIKRYLYDGLTYKISTGVKPVLVNGDIVKTKQTVPKATWNIDFGKSDTEIKNAIEHTILLEPNNTYIRSFVGPAFYIGKRIDAVSGVISYYMSYIYEFDYYKKFVNKPLAYEVDGTDHLIEGAIRVPISQTDLDDRIVVDQPVELPRKLYFNKTELSITHQYNGISGMKLECYEQAQPLPYTSVFIIGGSNDSYLDYC